MKKKNEKKRNENKNKNKQRKVKASRKKYKVVKREKMYKAHVTPSHHIRRRPLFDDATSVK
jgi:hypothetical protein